MNDEKDILAQAAEIVNASAEELDNEVKKHQLEHFVAIEGEMFKTFGFDDEASYMFHMMMVADTPEEVKAIEEQYKDTPSMTIMNPSNDGEIHSAMAVKAVGKSGNLYDLLGNKLSGLRFAEDNNSVGCIVRCGAFMTPTEGVIPSEAEDKEDCIITIMITSDRIQTIVRKSDNPDETITQQSNIEDYEPGKQKLIDALFDYYYMPRLMRVNAPELFKALVKDYEAQEKK
jgi:hypothetical protein